MKLKLLLLLFFIGSLLACQKPDDAVVPSPNDPRTGSPVTPTTGGDATEVGQPVGTPVTQTIGPAGGSIALPDGSLTLNFPAGAVSKETVISIQIIENKAFQGAGKAYRFGPDGTQFTKPITMTWHYTDDDMGGSAPEALAIAYQDKQGVWMANSNVEVNKNTKTVSAQLPHFSDWTLLFKYLLFCDAGPANFSSTDSPETLPASYYLTAAESTKLHVASVKDPHNDTSKDSYWAMSKPYIMSSEKIIAWRVNGKTDPTYSQEGQLTTDKNYAETVYSAPPRQPAVNPVAVAVEINGGSEGKLILVNYINIEPHATLTVAGSTNNNPNVQLTFFGQKNYLYGMITDSTGTEMGVTFVIKNFRGNGTYSVDKDHNVTITAMQRGNVPYSDYYVEVPSGKYVSGGGKIVISGYDSYRKIVVGTVSGTTYFYKDLNSVVPIPKPILAQFQGKIISTEVPPTPAG